MQAFLSFLGRLRDAGRDLAPIMAVVAIFQFGVLQRTPPDMMAILAGLVIVAVGLALFLQGLEVGIFPLGESLADQFARKGSVFWLLLFGFLVGFATTAAEPSLIAIADRAEVISEGRLDALGLRMTVALSVGAALGIGILRILLGHPIHYYIITGYLLVLVATYFAPQEIVGLAYDSGGVTTSTVTVPLVAALGVGLASSIKGRSPLIDGFGLIAFASLLPMIFVQVYGILVYALAEPASAGLAAADPAPGGSPAALSHLGVMVVLQGLLGVFRDTLPIILVILGAQYLVIRHPLARLRKVTGGFGMVILGLYAFILGLDLGLFPLGESMALQLTESAGRTAIYLFAFLVGFATTMAEPSLIAIAEKAEEVSQGGIRQLVLRVAVAIGVGAGITLGCHRIMAGDPIHYYIMAGYAAVIGLTFFAPRYLVPIAYDSGGVTTSTVTVPLVAALGLGLAKNIEGRDPLIDGFGLIAFASLFPMITVLGYGWLQETLLRRRKEQAT
ncbi:DUF1538 domain-containing protein [Thiohalorhabdus methylotrophus]|uniref:DUF1538 domain-containing protein n=1 Tax=Thiohalorhabdus methylotrophus TaxID=3242694 RepID=A0ABV4TWS5_9GAMM